MFDKLTYLYKNHHYYFPLIIAFLMPFGFPIANVIALWIIAFFSINTELKPTLKRVFENKWLYVYWSFFLLHIISAFFSTNKTEAITGIEIKLTFFILPFLFFGVTYSNFKIDKIKRAFVVGCSLALLFCLLRALYFYVAEQQNFFFYSDFTFFLHPSYFAMYLLLAIIFVLSNKIEFLNTVNKKVFIKASLTLFFLMGIFLASSKMGIISTLLILPIVLSAYVYRLGYKKTIAFILIAFIGCGTLLYCQFPDKFERFQTAFSVTTSQQHIDLTATESTAVRILIWQQSIEIIKTQPIFGTSIGDANDALYAAYQQKGLTGALAKKLNAHNQYLQTSIGTGIIGFILLLLLTVGVLFFSIIKKQYVLLVFSCIIILNFLVESMLQAQAGFFFFVFFGCFLINTAYRNKKHSISNF